MAKVSIKRQVSNKEVKFDKEDLSLFNSYSWCLTTSKRQTQYLVARVDGKVEKFHRIIMQAPKGKQVDHINRDTLDNRRSNLRLVSQIQNSANSYRGSPNGKGVTKQSGCNSWAARINVDSLYVGIGTFPTKREAQDAYDEIAIEWFGEYALTNKQLRKEGLIA